MNRINTIKININFIRASVLLLCGLFCFSFLFGACRQLEKPKPAPFYSDAAPPPLKEFRWSNGGRLPASFDPALAAAAPETDVARALYEGLTDTDAGTLKTVSAVAVDWSASDDNRTWTFKLRGDARWSNGERVTAADFVRSWKRLAALGAKVPHFNLLSNIVGMPTTQSEANPVKNQDGSELSSQKNLNSNLPHVFKPSGGVTDAKSETNLQSEAIGQQTETSNGSIAESKGGERENAKKDEPETKTTAKNQIAFGAVAVDDFTLKVSLLKPDKDFPALVAHPVFRPVFGDGKNLGTEQINADVVTNGAFRFLSVNSTDGVTLERSKSFWNRNQIELERVRFVPSGNAESALEAYRAGAIDAVTNADFEPLALKLLMPFDDFRRTPHSALNFYEFNREKAPFDDRRVREALSIAVERERLTQDELDGASLPALHFLPFGDETNQSLSQNVARARNLLSAAGFAAGENFPTVKLVVNRNNVQQRIARAVAKMWKQNLNVETEIVVKEPSEIETARAAGDYDVLRRGALFATTDEAMNMRTIFAAENPSQKTPAEKRAADKAGKENKNSEGENSQANTDAFLSANTSGEPSAAKNRRSESSVQTPVENEKANGEILTEADALAEFVAIPLYFSTSYSLVKPYVRGFDTNTLDAPSLKDVRIDIDWQPKTAKGEPERDTNQ